MKQVLFLLLIAAITLAQPQPKCSICLKVSNCPPDLLTDPFVDPIYNFIVQQISSSEYPQQIEKVVNQAQANYTFTWKTATYLAVVDLSTKKFTVMTIQRPNQLLDAQNKIGIRQRNSVSASSSSKDLLNYIDKDLRSKFFPNQEVKMVESIAIEEGYYVVYQNSEGKLSAFNVAIQNNAGNIVVTYNATSLRNNNKGDTASTQPSTSNAPSSSQVQKQPNQQASSVQTPTVGGYQTVSNPTANADIIGVLNFLIGKVDNILQYGSLLKAESQLVSGYNYRLTISFDPSSSAYYVIIVYRNLSGQYSVTSIDLLNVNESYSFTNALTGDQILKVPYLSLIHNALVQRLNNILVPGTLLDKLFINFPYYKLVYRNDAMSQINIIVSFDILKKNLNVIETSALGQPAKQEAPKQSIAQNQPQNQINQQKNSKNQQSSINQAKGSQQKQQQQQQQQQQSKNSQQKHQNPDQFEPISSDLQTRPFIKAYIQYLSSLDTRFNVNNLIGIYSKKNDRNFLSFRYKSSGSSIVSSEASIDYIQFILSRTRSPRRATRIPYCLQQNRDICVKCQVRYYLNGGKCYEVPSACSQFDYQLNLCQACYQGYYLDINNVCQTAHFLCMTSDKKGNCLSCYNNYRLTANGRCVYNAEGADFRLPEQHNNPLCSIFSGLKCLACVQGCYLSRGGFCKVPDPNCSRFDTQNEKCLVCMQNYELKNGESWCVRSKNY